MNDVSSLFTAIIPAISFCDQTQNAVNRLVDVYPNISIIIVLDLPTTHELPVNVTVLINSGTISEKRNIGASEVKTKYISFLDSDAQACVGWLESASLRFQKDETIDIVAGPNLPFPHESQSQKLSYVATKSFLVSWGGGYEKTTRFDGYVESAPSCNLHIKTEVYKSIGGMNETLVTGEDLDLCFKIIQKKKKIYFDKNVQVLHRNRKFLGFFFQRLLWGNTALSFLKVVKFKTGVYMLAPAVFISILLLIFLLSLIVPKVILAFFFIVFIYLAVTVIEAVRVSDSIIDSPVLIFYLMVGNLAPGFGTILDLMRIPINFKKNYRNNS